MKQKIGNINGTTDAEPQMRDLPKQNNWEHKFNNWFDKEFMQGFSKGDLKDFIRQLLQEQREDLIEWAEKRKSGYLQKILYKLENTIEFNNGYNQVLSDLINYLKDEK